VGRLASTAAALLGAAALATGTGSSHRLALGCSGDCAFDDVDVAGRTTSPSGAAYPTGDFGFRPRDGTVAGQLVPNLTFHGYPGSERADGLQAVSVADFYDPEAESHRVLLLSAIVMWCPHCGAETDTLSGLAATLRSEGAEILQIAIDGPDQGVAPDRCDLDSWVDEKSTSFTVVIDGNARRMSQYTSVSSVPWNALVDARTMEVLDVTMGEPADVAGYVRSALDWVDSHPL
jgi:hypothetical protein